MVYRRVTDKSLVLIMRMTSQGVRILAAMVMARFVSDKEFGRMELVASIPGFLSAVGDFGVTRSISAAHDLPEEQVQDTALTMMVSFAVVFAVLAIIGGWYYDVKFSDSRLRWVGIIVGATFIVQNIQQTQVALLARELRFLRWAWVEAMTGLVVIASGVGIAVWGGGVFALAIQQLVGSLLGLLIIIRYKPLRRPRAWSRSTAKRYLSFGWKVTLFQYTNNVQPNISRQVVDRFAGVAAVGQFGRATQIRDLVGHNLATTFDLVLMPLFSRACNDMTRLRDLLIRGSVGIAIFCSFGAAWLAATSPDLIRVVLGRGWPDVSGLLQALAPGLALQSFGYACVILSLALNQPLVTFRYSVLQVIGLIIAAIVFWYTDLWHFALFQSLWTIAPTAYIIGWAAKSIGVRRLTFFRRLFPIVLEALVFFAVILLVRIGLIRLELLVWADLAGLVPNWHWLNLDLVTTTARLAVSSLIGAATAVVLFTFFDRKNLRDVLSLVLRSRRRNPADEIP